MEAPTHKSRDMACSRWHSFSPGVKLATGGHVLAFADSSASRCHCCGHYLAMQGFYRVHHSVDTICGPVPDHTTTSAHSKTHPVFACLPNLSWYCCMLCSSQDFQVISSALLPRGHNDAQKTCWHEQGAMACLRAAKLFQSCLSVQISTLIVIAIHCPPRRPQEHS